MAGHAVVPQLTVPSAPHRHIRRDSTADVGNPLTGGGRNGGPAASRPRRDPCDAGRWRARMHLYAAFLGGSLAGGRMGEGHEDVLARTGDGDGEGDGEGDGDGDGDKTEVDSFN